MSAEKIIYVYFDSGLLPVPDFLGTLSAQTSRGRELFSFEFDKKWLGTHPEQSLDPDLQLYAGPQFTQKVNFGLFLDSAPDRWGRRLIQRREAIRAGKYGEKPEVQRESDYLLGVYDETRMGALRFKLDPRGAFLNDDSQMAAPPWTRLRELEEACRRFEEDATATEHEKWVSMLMAPGSSLGGARPKASVTAPDGTLWIAKFPSRNDSSNAAAWEHAVMLMARDAGLNVPEFGQEKFSKSGSTFLVKRFDRAGKQRIHFASAMTLLGMTDGADAGSGASYLDIAGFIVKYGASPEEDLRELWKRIVFSIAVSNTDDHLRNHGFLLSGSGWRLSPVYDLNPDPHGHGLSLNISENDNSLDFSPALETAQFFRIGKSEAENILKKTSKVVSQWRAYASRSGIGRGEQEDMRTAFRTE